MKRKKENRYGLPPHWNGKVKVKRKRNSSDFDIQFLKMQLETLNHAIRKAEEEGNLNFEVLGKLHDFKTKDMNDISAIEYFKLLSQIYTKDPSKIEELKHMRDKLIGLLKNIEDKKKEVNK